MIGLIRLHYNGGNALQDQASSLMHFNDVATASSELSANRLRRSPAAQDVCNPHAMRVHDGESWNNQNTEVLLVKRCDISPSWPKLAMSYWKSSSKMTPVRVLGLSTADMTPSCALIEGWKTCSRWPSC